MTTTTRVTLLSRVTSRHCHASVTRDTKRYVTLLSRRDPSRATARACAIAVARGRGRVNPSPTGSAQCFRAPGRATR